MARYSNPGAGTDRPKGQDIRALRRVVEFLKPYWLRVIGALAALAVTAGATLSIGQGLRGLIDRGLSGEAPETLNNALIFLLMLGVIIAAGSYVRFYLMTWLGERVVADIRNAVFKRIIKLDQSFFEVTRLGEILSRLTTDTTLLQTVVGSSMSMALRNIIMMVGGLAMMVATNAKLALLALILVPLVVGPVLIIGRRLRKLSRETQDRRRGCWRVRRRKPERHHDAAGIHTRKSRYPTLFRGSFRRVRHRAYTRPGAQLAERHRDIGGVYRDRRRDFGSVAGDVLAGRITGGELGAFLFYAMIVAFSAGIVSEVYGDLQRAAGATERLVDLLETEPGIRAPANPVAFTLPTSSADAGRVTFDAVTFHYPSRPDRAALADFSLVIEPGETVALVGPSGAGKSTVFQLLLRFYDPNDGTIQVDNVNIKDAAPEEVRKRLALVPQDPFLFGSTAAANIRYGDPDADMDAVRAAARDARADEFIDSLPEGYETYLGEKGIRLSGGQTPAGVYRAGDFARPIGVAFGRSDQRAGCRKRTLGPRSVAKADEGPDHLGHRTPARHGHQRRPHRGDERGPD